MRSAWCLALTLVLAVAGSAHARKSVADLAKEDRVRPLPRAKQE